MKKHQLLLKARRRSFESFTPNEEEIANQVDAAAENGKMGRNNNRRHSSLEFTVEYRKQFSHSKFLLNHRQPFADDEERSKKEQEQQHEHQPIEMQDKANFQWGPQLPTLTPPSPVVKVQVYGNANPFGSPATDSNENKVKKWSEIEWPQRFWTTYQDCEEEEDWWTDGRAQDKRQWVAARRSTWALALAAKESPAGRPRWRNQREFALCCVCFVVGLGNLWRFPYLCYEHGRAAFLLAYLCCAVAMGFPLFLMEVGLGQQLQTGFLRMWRQFDGRLTGVGITSVAVAFLCAVYYNVIVAYALYYFCNSFRHTLPWQHGGIDSTDSANKFWVEHVLKRSPRMGFPQFGLLLCLAAVWSWFFLLMGRTQRYTSIWIAVLPFAGLLVLLIKGLTLPGAGKGLASLFLHMEWRRLLQVKLWAAAAGQVFFSLGVGWGCLVNYASFNHRSFEFFRISILVVAANYCASILSAGVTFAALGHLGVAPGSGLVFVSYPAVLASLPWAQLWSAAFFALLVTLGGSSAFAMVEIALTAMAEASVLRSVPRKTLAAAFCGGSCCLGAFLLTPKGGYWVDLLDGFVAAVALYVVAVAEVLGVIFCYGLDRLSDDFFHMTGKRIGRGSRLWVKWFLPFALIGALLAGLSASLASQNVKRELHDGWGCGNQCGATENRGVCDVEQNYCLCSPGWQGVFCDEKSDNPDLIGCPENCNGGICTSGVCRCAVEMTGPSCRQFRFARASSLGTKLASWTIALIGLLPIIVVFVSHRAQSAVTAALDDVAGVDMPELPRTSGKVDFAPLEDLEEDLWQKTQEKENS